uniref:Uncharacterized protein n=1 Tax=viral metagenome TaxID=1070528 RepID=A0A6C0KY31_9ZZZZ
MSFLGTRLFASLNKATEDPVAEKKLREQQREAKDQIREYKTKLADERTLVKIALTKKQIFKVDADLLLAMLDELTKYLDDPNTLSLVKDDIKDKWEDTFNAHKYYALARIAFQQGVYPGGKQGDFPVRYITHGGLAFFKQFRHDVVKIKPAVKAELDDGIKACEAFLKDNIYSTQDVYTTYWQSVQEELNTVLKDPENKEVWDKNQGLVFAKIQKNNGLLDFEETPGAPTANATARAEGAQLEKFKSDAEKDDFNVTRLLKNAFNNGISYVVLAVVIFVLLLGSSMAVNLNMYKPMPFKILYAIWGFLFGLIVVPYVLLYRWYWLGKQPRYYGFLPFIPRFFVNPLAQFVFGWLTYKPDDRMGETQEWIKKDES